MSKTARRPADQPNQRRTARKVSRASSSPDSTSSETPVSVSTCARTSSELTASRTAEVAKPSISSQPLSSAIRVAAAQKSVRASTPFWVTAPSGSRCSARRSACLWEDAGSGAAPPCASTTSRWPVLEPMSRTPRRMMTTLLGSPRARSRPGLSPCPRRVRGPRRRDPGLPLRPHLADVLLHVHLRPGLPGHLCRCARRRLLHPRRPLRRQGRREARRRQRLAADARRLAVPPRAAR